MGLKEMTDLEPFVRQVIKHPDDDGPRLVCADRLDEIGQVYRAEFIRVQCRISDLNRQRLENADGDIKNVRNSPLGSRKRKLDKLLLNMYSPLRRQEYELLNNNREEWSWDFSPDPKEEWYHLTDGGLVCPRIGWEVKYRRGFVAEVSLPLAAFLVGRFCYRCNGTGLIMRGIQPRRQEYSPDIQYIIKPPSVVDFDCPACNGTGISPDFGGAAKALFQNHPIEKVTLSDRAVIGSVTDPVTGMLMSWYNKKMDGDTVQEWDSDDLPSELWELLPESSRHVDQWGNTTGWTGFENVEDANRQLSLAAWKYGRKAAGLSY
jgi:uncharacterized protein (TIGR02996 family)